VLHWAPRPELLRLLLAEWRRDERRSDQVHAQRRVLAPHRVHAPLCRI
jgi:hypothetical protein